MPHTVYVLGAGSSVAAGAPLMNGFKEAAIRTADDVNPSVGGGLGRFREALNFWIKTVPTANIEEFYLLTDLSSRLGIGDPLYKRLGGPLGSVQYLIAKTLEINMGTTISGIHRQFIEVLFRIPRHESEVISLNWDIALDRAMMRMHGSNSIKYGYMKTKPLKTIPPRLMHANLTVFKLHGSTNWWICERCHTLWYDTETKSTVAYWEEMSPPKCIDHECEGRMAPLMLPPSSQKFDSSQFIPVLADIWKGARQAIATCRELVFIGYSFPKTDVQFKMFLHEALSTNTTLQTLAVVTNPKLGSERVSFEDHYSDIFRGSNHHEKLRFLYHTFEEWVTERHCTLSES